MSEAKALHAAADIKLAPLVTVLMSGAFIAILNQTLLVTALPKMMEDLNILANTAQWLVSIFMLVNGIMIPITAFLIEKFSTRKLFMTAIGSFTAGTLICALAPNFAVLIIGRIVQAAGAGIMMPLMQTVFFIIFPIEKRGTAMGMFGMIIAFAPAIGPTLSGWIVDEHSWRVLFYMLLPIGIIDTILAWFLLKNVTEQSNPKVDMPSIILSTLGFGGLLYGFSIAGNAGWISIDVGVSLLLGAVTLSSFIFRQLRLERPVLEFRVFQNKIFSLTTALGMIVFLSLIGGTTLLPLYMQDMHHFTALQSGLALLPGAILMGLMSPVSGRIFDRVGARGLMITGLFLITVTSFLLTNLTLNTSFAYIAIVNAIRMLGVSMVLMPSTTAGINQLSPRLIPHGTAMNNTLRQMAGSIGTALLVTIMTGTAALSNRANELERMVHGVNMAFIAAALLAFVGLILTFFIRGTRPLPAGGRGGNSDSTQTAAHRR